MDILTDSARQLLLGRSLAPDRCLTETEGEIKKERNILLMENNGILIRYAFLLIFIPPPPSLCLAQAVHGETPAFLPCIYTVLQCA